MKKQQNGKKWKFSKKDKLVLANGLFFICLVFAVFWGWATGEFPNLLWYLILQCLFTFFSLILYYFIRLVEAKEREVVATEKIAALLEQDGGCGIREKACEHNIHEEKGEK